jgi:hypothetical protein
MKMKLLIVAIMVMMTAMTATAEVNNPAMHQAATIKLGAFWGNFDTTVKALGEDANFDQSLSESDTNFAAEGIWRITPRWKTELGYSKLTSSSSGRVPPNFVNLKNDFETSVFRVAGGYSIYRTDATEMGVDLAVNFTSIKNSTKIAINGFKLTDLDVNEPLPTIGVFLNHAFTDEWYLTTHAGLFAFDIGDVEGTIFDIKAGIEYRPWENYGFGLSYIYNTADLDISDGHLTFDVDYDYYGPTLYFVAGF